MLIHLGGHLSWYDGEKRDWVTIDQPVPIPLQDLPALLGLPPLEIAIIAVNGRMTTWDAPSVTDSDVIEFYPPIGGG